MPKNLATELADRKKDCLACGGTGLSFDGPHQTCRGTGEVYLLDDSVRPRCTHIPWHLSNMDIALWHENNDVWHEGVCRGWTVPADLATWAKASYPIMEASKAKPGVSRLFEEYALACAKGNLLGALACVKQVLEKGVKNA
ncbi:MAG: hypothetical protein V2A53_02625 [bacterium]